jgi:hypothetical protein
MKLHFFFVAASLGFGSLASAFSNSASDMPATVYKRPANGIVNVRNFASHAVLELHVPTTQLLRPTAVSPAPL